jgi:hypothetical protein
VGPPVRPAYLVLPILGVNRYVACRLEIEILYLLICAYLHMEGNLGHCVCIRDKEERKPALREEKIQIKSIQCYCKVAKSLISRDFTRESRVHIL